MFPSLQASIDVPLPHRQARWLFSLESSSRMDGRRIGDGQWIGIHGGKPPCPLKLLSLFCFEED
jgi:hypothetical protein